MVAIIKTGPSIHRAFNYNEQKVKQGVAECILAANYPKDLESLTLTGKLNRLLNQAALNENVTRNSVHISLNFDPSEKIIPYILGEIAQAYMKQIGFGDQPYLVYQHHDAGHPHIHVVSVKVRSDGSRIDTQNIGRNQSEKARKLIEQLFNLVKADQKKQNQVYQLKPVSIEKLQYGKKETKRAITNVLDAVLNTYKYTSLPELNAVLKQYNVKADRGNEGSRIFRNSGLVYRIIDTNGNPVGVPIKASGFYNKPTLKMLEARYQQNDVARQSKKSRLKNAIDLHLLKGSNLSVQSLVNSLEKQGIHTVLRQNKQGVLYGITYVDHQTKCVFNGSDLGKQYSAKAVQDRCNQAHLSKANPSYPKQSNTWQLNDQQNQENGASQSLSLSALKLIEDLLAPSQSQDNLPHQLKNTKRKKRKRISNRL